MASFERVVWEIGRDSSGRLYWYNTITRMVTYDPPTMGLSLPGAGAGFPHQPQGGLPPCLPGAMGMPPSVSMGGADWPWTEHKDSVTKTKFWYNQLTGESTWDKPEMKKSKPKPPPPKPPSLPKPSESESDQWLKIIDPKSNTLYWYNKKTGKTEKERPSSYCTKYR